MQNETEKPKGNAFSEWLPYNVNDTSETLTQIGWECDSCGCFAMGRYAECPHCHKRMVNADDRCRD